MKGAIFNANNKYGDIFQFSTTGTSVYVNTSFSDNPPATSDRVLVGISGITTSFSGGNSYLYTGLTSGVTKTVQIKTNRIGELGRAVFYNGSNDTGGRITNTLDFSKWKKMEDIFNVQQSPSLNGITMPNPWAGTGSTSYQMSGDIFIVNTGIQNLNLSQFIRYRDLDINNNPSLTGITFPNSVSLGRFHNIHSNNLQGHLNLSTLTGLQTRYSFIFYSNPGITGVTFPNVSHRNTGSISSPAVLGSSCDIQGNLDLTPLTGFPANIAFGNNSITGITFPSFATMSSAPNTIVLSGCSLFDFGLNNITGNLDLSMFKKLYNIFRLDFNPNLTGVTFSCTGTNNFNEFRIDSSNLTGNLDLSSLIGRLGGTFLLDNNPLLTGITFSSSNNMIVSGTSPRFYINSCNLTGTLNMSNITGLNTEFRVYGNPNLTQILHGPSSSTFVRFLAYSCNLTGTYNLSMLSGLSGSIQIYFNPLLTNVVFPPSVQQFNNVGTNANDSAFTLGSNNLDYVDFKPLSGATLFNGSRIRLLNNNMSAADVNHILVDFVTIATSNPSGWDYVVLDIGGTNVNPDSSSGGYNGLAAIATLTGVTYNWSITY
jgi:hypothetical protein